MPAANTYLPPMPIGGVMVLGHNFDSEHGYELSRDKGQENLKSPTWRPLLMVLDRANIVLEQCFFTNLYMGLITGNKSTGQFPGANDPAFVKRCRRFLSEQIAVQQPRLILTLGRFVPALLAPLSNDLVPWSSVVAWERLDDEGRQLIHGVQFARSPNAATVVALTHPSRRHLNVGRRRYRDQEGDNAERAMLQEAIVRSGVDT